MLPWDDDLDLAMDVEDIAAFNETIMKEVYNSPYPLSMRPSFLTTPLPRRDWKVSELESVIIHFYAKLESVRIGKCQNWKVSESESVRIGKCQNC